MKQLEQIRRDLGWNQKTFGEVLNISTSTVSRAEIYVYVAPLRTIKKVRSALGVRYAEAQRLLESTLEPKEEAFFLRKIRRKGQGA